MWRYRGIPVTGPGEGVIALVGVGPVLDEELLGFFLAESGDGFGWEVKVCVQGLG